MLQRLIAKCSEQLLILETNRLIMPPEVDVDYLILVLANQRLDYRKRLAQQEAADK